MKSFLMLLTVGFFTLSAKAEWYVPHSFNLGIKNLTQYVDRVQTDDKGSTYKFDVEMMVSSALDWQVYQDWHLSAELGFGLPKKGRDQNITKLQYYLLFPVQYRWDNFKFSAGPGFFFTYLTAKGGTQQLRNGNSTEDFFLPSGSSTARNLVATTGIDWMFYPDLQVGAQILVFNANDSKNRAVSYLLGITYRFGLGTSKAKTQW